MVGVTRDEMVGVVERLVNELADMHIAGFVENTRAVAPRTHHLREAQLGEVLGHRRRMGAHMIGEIVDRMLTVRQGVQDP